MATSNVSSTDIVDIYIRERQMGMTKTPVEIDDEALAAAAKVLGTTTKKDTVNAALREVSARLTRLKALEELGAMADRGDFDAFLADSECGRT